MRSLGILPVLLTLCPGAPAQDVPAVAARRTLDETLARVRTATGSADFARKGHPLTLGGRSLAMGVESEAYLTFSPGGNFVHRVTGPLGSTVGYDGETAWKKGFDGTVRPIALEEHDEELLTHWIWTGHWLAPRAPIEIAWADEDVDGTLLRVTLRGTPMEVRLRIDAETGLPLEMVRETDAGHTTWGFADWRDAGGLRLPYELSTAEEGGPEGWTRWTELSTPPTFVRSPYTPPRGPPGDSTFVAGIPDELETQKLLTEHVLVHPTIEGEDVGWFFLDTGAGGMCIDTSVADELGLARIGEVQAVGWAARRPRPFARAGCSSSGPCASRTRCTSSWISPSSPASSTRRSWASSATTSSRAPSSSSIRRPARRASTIRRPTR